MIEFEFDFALQSWSGVAESLHAAGLDSGLPSHEHAAPRDDAWERREASPP